MTWIGEYSFTHQLMLIIRIELFEQTGKVTRAKPGIYLRNVFLQIIFIALWKAAGDVYFFHQAFFLGIHVAEDRVDGFLFRVINKSTGVDHHDVRIIFPGFMGDLNSIPAQLCKQNFRIDLVLGTAQGDYIDFGFFAAFGFQLEFEN